MLTEQKLAELRRLETLLKAKEQKKADEAKAKLAFSRYRVEARETQLPPEGNWFIWLILSGRGWGKTFTGSGWLVEKALNNPGTEWAIVAPTYTDVRRTCVEGPSGILKALMPGQLKFYNRSNGEITLANGSKLHMISADEPDRARGLNLSGAWLDEFAAWRYDQTWTEGLAPALRIGQPQVVITTTPRPTKLIKEFTNRTDGSVVVTRGSTFDNAANLSEAALAELRSRYEGTRIGRQELYGEIVDDVEGSLWTASMLDETRVQEIPELVRVVVAVDPAVTSGAESDETGIVVVGKGADGRAYVLADRSCKDTPYGWAQRVALAYEEFKADRVVAEKNQGGDFIEQTLHQIDPGMAFKGVTAKQGKRLRAEPVAALYEQARVSHVGYFETLETQMTEWLPDSGKSPDRLDALVHGITELGFGNTGTADLFFASISADCPSCGMPNSLDAQHCVSCAKELTRTDGTITPFPYPL
jgi:phage terminase large subunit-like protein